ncbi:MAG: HD family hydrolase [Candidatus Coprovivens sp.]
MKEISDALRFYYLATELKNLIRKGWDETHWNITAERRESVAEHVFGTCILAITMKNRTKSNINLDKVLKMLIIHELGEVLIGDITQFQNVTKEEKKEKELKAVKEITKSLPNSEEIVNLYIEFDDGQTEDAKFAYQCDKLEADLQSKYYQDNGNHRDLNDQEGNIVMEFSKTKEMLKTAKTPFDIWYEYDKPLYEDDSFKKTLEYLKSHNINEIKK